MSQNVGLEAAINGTCQGLTHVAVPCSRQRLQIALHRGKVELAERSVFRPRPLRRKLFDGIFSCANLEICLRIICSMPERPNRHSFRNGS